MPTPLDHLFTPPGLVGRGAPPPAAAGRSPFDDLFAPDAPGGPSAIAPTAAAPMPAAATPPIAPMASVRTPPFVAPQAPAEKSPNFLSMVLPILASTVVGRRDPRAIAQGLAGFMKGRELKRAERESTQQTAERKQAEQADFYGRALTQAQSFDDPVAFAQWQHAIAPVAQLHGIDPNVFTFNDTKLAARTKKEAGDLLDTLDKQHPDGNYTLDWKDPKTGAVRRITRAQLAAIAGVSAFDDQGKTLVPGSTVNAQRFIAEIRNADGTTSKVYAFEDPKTKKVTDGTGRDITTQIVPPDTIEKPLRVEGLLKGKTAFAFQKGTKFYDSDGTDITKAFRPLQTVSEREAEQGDAAPLLTPAGLDAAARNYAQTGQLPAMGMGKSSAGVRAQIINRAAELNPDLDIAGNRADYGADAATLRTLQGQRSAIGAFEQTAQKNIDIFLETAGKVVDTGSPLANRVARSLTGNVLGSADQAAYDAARQVAINEIAKITSNPTLAGQLSDSARHEVDAFNPGTATLRQTVAVMRLLKRDMQNRTKSLDDAIATIRNRRPGSGGSTSTNGKPGDAPKVIRYDMNGKPLP